MGVGVTAHVGPQDLCADFGFSSGETGPPCRTCKSGNPLQYSCLENPVDRRAWWAAVHGVAQSRTLLKRLGMHACIGEGNGSPLQCSFLENPRDGGAWWATVYRVAQSRTRLKRLNSSQDMTYILGASLWPQDGTQ